MLLKSLCVVMSLLSLTGCASVTGSKLQPVSVQTIHENQEVSGVGCTLTNDADKWYVTTPGSVTIQKSTGDLAVECKKDGVAGRETVVSKGNGAVWGNILIGGGIGYVIDRNTGAGFDYPTSITVAVRKVTESVGLVAPTSVAEAEAKSTTPADIKPDTKAEVQPEIKTEPKP